MCHPPSDFRKAVMMIVDHAAAVRKAIPEKKEPVVSLRYPIRKGPKNPPISPTEKNRPPTVPMRSAPISGISMSVTVRTGIRALVKKPADKIPVQREKPSPTPTRRIVTPEIRRTAAMVNLLYFKRYMNCGKATLPRIPDRVIRDVA